MRLRALGTLAALFLAAPALANNIITAEHPPFGEKGYALQVDNRVIAQKASRFVDAAGDARALDSSVLADLFIVRAYFPGWLARVSVQYTSLDVNSAKRSGMGDLAAEAGLSGESGDCRWRALLALKAPTGTFDAGRAVNTGSGQWDAGANFSFTRYLADKKADLNLYAQYLFRFTNPENRVKPGNEFSYAVAAAYLIGAGKVPVRAGLEHRGMLADSGERGGSRFGAAKKQLSAGPSLLINLGRYVQGFTLWPTAQFDFYNRNCARASLYYLKLQYNY